MKIRLGFVSNSSSSSFIIAVKSGISEEEKNSIFEYYIESYYKNSCKEWGSDTEVTEDKVIRAIFKNIRGGHLELGDWSIHWGECGSESDFLSYLLYCLPEIDTPKFKFKSYC